MWGSLVTLVNVLLWHHSNKILVEVDSREHGRREKLEIWSSTDNFFSFSLLVWRNLVLAGERCVRKIRGLI